MLAKSVILALLTARYLLYEYQLDTAGKLQEQNQRAVVVEYQRVLTFKTTLDF
jgi:hypothetical protein